MVAPGAGGVHLGHQSAPGITARHPDQQMPREHEVLQQREARQVLLLPAPDRVGRGMGVPRPASCRIASRGAVTPAARMARSADDGRPVHSTPFGPTAAPSPALVSTDMLHGRVTPANDGLGTVVTALLLMRRSPTVVAR